MATGTIILPILAAVPDPTNPPGLEFSANGRPYLTFDGGATDELCSWQFRMPENYSSVPKVKVLYSMVSSVSTSEAMEVELMGVADDADIDTDAYDTANASDAETAPGTAGLMGSFSITCTTHDGSPSAVVANGYVSLRLRRDAGSGGADDMEVWAVTLEYTTT